LVGVGGDAASFLMGFNHEGAVLGSKKTVGKNVE
jgi:hypothetical protein